MKRIMSFLTLLLLCSIGYSQQYLISSDTFLQTFVCSNTITSFPAANTINPISLKTFVVVTPLVVQNSYNSFEGTYLNRIETETIILDNNIRNVMSSYNNCFELKTLNNALYE